MKWILFLMVQASGSGLPALTAIEFDDVTACSFAERALTQKMRGTYPAISLTSVCLPKGAVPEMFQK